MPPYFPPDEPAGTVEIKSVRNALDYCLNFQDYCHREHKIHN
jgi:hypothetical protein